MKLRSEQDVLLVVAHPDDEVLWLAPVLPSATTVVAVLPEADPELTDHRRQVQESYGVAELVFLGLRSADIWPQRDGVGARPVAHGVTLLPSCPPENSMRYQSNFPAMLEALEPYFRSRPVVYTHNPWGEYGHPEHVQVSNAVMELARTHRCSVWAWEGFSSKWQLENGSRLRADYFPERLLAGVPSTELVLDLALFRELRELYETHRAWTWSPDYEPPNPSQFIQVARDGTALITPRRRRAIRSLRIATKRTAGVRHALMQRWKMGLQEGRGTSDSGNRANH